MAIVSIEEFSLRVKRMIAVFPDHVHIFHTFLLEPEYEGTLVSLFHSCAILGEVFHCYPFAETKPEKVLQHGYALFQERHEEIRLEHFFGFSSGSYFSEELTSDYSSMSNYPEIGIPEIKRQVLEALYGPTWKTIKITAWKVPVPTDTIKLA